MFGNIRKPNQKKPQVFDPDEYFDPITKTATQADFMRLLDDGIYIADVIGYKVAFEGYQGSGFSTVTYVIADVNHDSENTGQTNCYDLISENIYLKTSLDNGIEYSLNQIKPLSTFSSKHLMQIKYEKNGTQYNNKLIISPSLTELNFTSPLSGQSGDNGNFNIEGVSYPIFTDNTSRKKIMIPYNSGSQALYQTRSTNIYGQFAYINDYGAGDLTYYTDTEMYVCGIIRVQ